MFETASCSDIDLLLEFTRRFGADRVVYGSQHHSRIDRAGNDTAHERRSAATLDDIVTARTLTDDEKSLVPGGNARRVLGIETPSD